MKKLFYIFMIVSLFTFFQCDENVEEKTDTITLTLNAEHSSIADGIIVYAMVLAPGDDWSDTPLYEGSAVFENHTATISVNDIEEGQYTLLAYIDVNSTTNMNEGDYAFTIEDTFVINEDRTLSATDGDPVGDKTWLHVAM